MIFETINKQKGGDLLGEYAEGLTNDRNLRHNVQCVLVTKQQAKQNSYYNSLVTKNITLSDLMND